MSSLTAFVRDNTALVSLPFVPEVRLHLAVGESVELWETSGGAAPPFWAFAWAGGLALARHVLDHPELVRGRRVLDVATGSGLVAIAAALAGAQRVTAYDIDPVAVVAARRNAERNGVRIHACVRDVSDDAARADLAATRDDVVLAGDVFYDCAMATTFRTALHAARAAGADVLVGDPLRAYLPTEELDVLSTYDVDVDPDLEAAPVKRSVVARLRSTPISSATRTR
jgi:predicted nicotinamide N-methyase